MSDAIRKAAEGLDAAGTLISDLARIIPMPPAVTAGMLTAGAASKTLARLMQVHGLSVGEILAKLEPAVPAVRPWDMDALLDTQPGTPGALAAAKDAGK